MNFQTTKCLNADVPLMDFKGGKKKRKQIWKSIKQTPWGHPVLGSLARHKTFRGLKLPFKRENPAANTRFCCFLSAFMQNPPLLTRWRYAICITQHQTCPKGSCTLKLHEPFYSRHHHHSNLLYGRWVTGKAHNLRQTLTIVCGFKKKQLAKNLFRFSDFEKKNFRVF